VVRPHHDFGSESRHDTMSRPRVAVAKHGAASFSAYDSWALERAPVGIGTSKYCVIFSVMHCQGSDVSEGRTAAVVVACLSTSRGFSAVADGDSGKNLADTPAAVATRAASPPTTRLERIFVFDDDEGETKDRTDDIGGGTKESGRTSTPGITYQFSRLLKSRLLEAGSQRKWILIQS
jgi:hypothetical protein